MAKEDPAEVEQRPVGSPASIVGMAYLAERVLDRASWPLILLIVLSSSAAEKFFDLLNKLLTAGPGHFWGFVFLAVLLLAFGALERRQGQKLSEQAATIRKLEDENREIKARLSGYLNR